MGHDKSYQQTGMMAYARILINMDTSGGVLDYITIQWRDKQRKQIIDYEGIPYRCRRCHQVGHLYRDCPLLKKSAIYNEEEPGPSTQDEPSGIQPPLPTEEMPRTQRTVYPQEEVTKDIAEDPSDPSSSSPAPVPPPTEHADLEHAGMSSSSSFPSDSPCISSHEASFIAYSAHPFPTLLDSSPMVTSHLTTLACSLPLPSLVDSSAITSTRDTLPPQSTRSPPRYSLRSRQKDKGPDVVGLDPTNMLLTLKNSRGRPSHSTKARHTADEEVALGRQQTIFRALRARNGPSLRPS